jgi:UDP-N-acetylglucosamine acyltransferase
MTEIHPTAIVHKAATIGKKVNIGPYSTIGPDVELGDGVDIISHAVVHGRTSIGTNTRIFPFASIGHQPQDQKYNGEPSSLVIGCNNVIREYVTMNPGTEGGGMVTRIGNNCLFMISAHVAHDCQIGDHVILVNNATLAGHVTIGEWAIIGGLSAVHQFVRIGQHAMVGGKTGVAEDVIPYGSVTGNRARLSGLNIIGLKRRKFSREDIHNLRKAYRMIFAEEGTLSERIQDVSELFPENEQVMDIVNFIKADSSRSICQPQNMEDAA